MRYQGVIMQGIDPYSQITAQFTLRWKSTEAEHTEMLWPHPVSFWRDVLEPERHKNSF